MNHESFHFQIIRHTDSEYSDSDEYYNDAPRTASSGIYSEDGRGGGGGRGGFGGGGNGAVELTNYNNNVGRLYKPRPIQGLASHMRIMKVPKIPQFIFKYGLVHQLVHYILLT